MKGDDCDLDAKIEEWLRWDRNPKTREEIELMVKDGRRDELEKVLMNRMTFGTAGLRARMAAGYSCMNDLVIVQTAQGLLKYLEQNDLDTLKNNGIVIGYDGRYNSKRFAELTAAIFLHAGRPVKLFSDLVPTPFVMFAALKWTCACGIVVTASHNPKEDNGYKVCGSNGAQIIPPVDKGIQNTILENLEPWETSWDTSIISSSQLLSDPLQEVLDSYYEIIRDTIFEDHKAHNLQTKVKFAYTAMHGVGYKYIVKAMDAAGLKVVPVVEQVEPDPEFPTVKFPNPEEGKSSLNLSIKTADENGCQIILANDPDADRLAVAEKNLDTGAWRVFTGNELGALLGYWMFSNHQKRYPNEQASNVYMLASTVSSKILRSMARKEGFNFIETLTGFKWMGNEGYDLVKKNNHVIFAYEEAIGFMCGSNVLDKDGVSAAVHIGTMVVHLYHHGLTLAQQLEDIYKEYGHHISNNSYYFCYDGPTIKNIFERLRNYAGKNTYPEDLLNGVYKIKSIRDLTTGYDNSQPNNKAILPTSKSSQMITFEFTNGLVATIRTSGTEPKIKYYTELCATPEQTNRNEILKISFEMVDALINEFLEPAKNGLTPKSN